MNELILAERIEKKLQEKREPVVFPLTPTHRKELRKLRNDNIGQMRGRLQTIKRLKKEEYTKKYQKDIEKELQKHSDVVKKLNSEWLDILDKIKSLLDKRKEAEDKHKKEIALFELSSGWGTLSSLDTKKVGDNRREFILDCSKASRKIAEEEFEKKYGESFKKAEEEIEKLHTMYEEAINFGDLEIVKEIYYKLKNAESFFKKVSNLKI